MKKTLKEKAAEKGIPLETVKRRMKRNGWSEHKALNTPLQVNKSHPRKKVDEEKIEDGFVIFLIVGVLGLVIFGLLWLITK